MFELFGNKTSFHVGDGAPVIQAVDQNGVMVDLSEAYARGPVLIYFYLRAGTPVCTAHACRFRDGLDQLDEHDIQIFGVSRDALDRLQKFKAKQRLSFQLLADPKGEIAAAFGVPSFFGFPARRAFLIRNGVLDWKGHASESSAIFRLIG